VKMMVILVELLEREESSIQTPTLIENEAME
jgi:hypothetical protein